MMERVNYVQNLANGLLAKEPTHLYCYDDRYYYYYSTPFAVNQYGGEAIKVKAVDRNDRNNFLLMHAPIEMLVESNGICMSEITRIQDFVLRNLFIIYELAREVNS